MYVVSNFFGMMERYHVDNDRSENLTIGLVLCFYAFSRFTEVEPK